MTPTPLLPSNPKDPTGVARLEAGAMLALGKRVRRATRAYIEAIDEFKPRIVVNAYAFELNQTILQAVMANLDTVVDSIFLEGGPSQLWFFNQYVDVAYQRGTAQQFANLSRQSPVYLGGRESIINLIRSEPYQTRIALIRAREFEEMKGLSGAVKSNMGRVLTDGMGRGLNPLDIARNLNTQAGVEINRANRIARTEIPTALRRAKMDEADDARERYNIETREMSLSALLPTTRTTHARRHGKLFTTDEQRTFYSKDGNSINCRCSAASIMVDKNGEPLNPRVVERARETYRIMAEKEGNEWEK